VKSAFGEEAKGDETSEVISALMLAVLQIYEHRTTTDIWSRLVEPLKALVPCEDVKIVVRTLGPQPVTVTREPEAVRGPFNPEVQRRVSQPICYVEQWSSQRIEGVAATSKRICRIPSQEAERQRWDQYEVGKFTLGSLRCLVALPLFDADGNVLAVAKLFNRRTRLQQPNLDFAKADLTMLSAFSAIFACVIPHPYLGLPGATLLRRPQVALSMSDTGVSAYVRWQLPRELMGALNHEIAYGEVSHDDEFMQTRDFPDTWEILPCGLLQAPPDSLDGGEFEYVVPNLKHDKAYAFCVRLRNPYTTLDWSEPTPKLSTYISPPLAPRSAAVTLFPLSESAVQLEWPSFESCDPALRRMEYRVVAKALMRNVAAAPADNVRPQAPLGSADLGKDEVGEQVVAVFTSDGSSEIESTTVVNLQSNITYAFAIEARYATIGSREFSCGLVSDQFCFPTVDITLPAPQPLNVDAAKQQQDGEAPLGAAVRLCWPYPSDLTAQLVLQYRVASLVGSDGRTNAEKPRFTVSTWHTVRNGECESAQLVNDEHSREIRVLHTPHLDGFRLPERPGDVPIALQVRVVTVPHGSSASPASAWFHPSAPAAPEGLSVEFAASDSVGPSLQIVWPEQKDGLFGSLLHNSAGNPELGPVGYAVQHDFSRGNGQLGSRFQVRIRPTNADGDPRGDWVQLEPQLLPALRRVGLVTNVHETSRQRGHRASAAIADYYSDADVLPSVGSVDMSPASARQGGPFAMFLEHHGQGPMGPSPQPPNVPRPQSRPPAPRRPPGDVCGLSELCYCYNMTESHWFNEPGAVYEIQVRQGNMLFWSSWSAGALARVQVKNPVPTAGDVLVLQEETADSVRLCWLPFVSHEAKLRSMEYKILCLEIPEDDKRPDAGGRVVAWRTIDTITTEVEDLSPMLSGALTPIQYTVRALSPSRRYAFAVECRYLGLPFALSSAAIARLEADEPLPLRDLQLAIVPDSLLAACTLAHGAKGPGSPFRPHGFNIKLRWQFTVSPIGISVPSVLCYQLCCSNEGSARGQALLPPALLAENAKCDGLGSFTVDRARNVISAEVELCASAVESLGLSLSHVQFTVRVSDPQGKFCVWSAATSNSIELALAPPIPVEGDALTITDEHRVRRTGAETPHAVEAVTLAWLPFRPAPLTPAEKHSQLEIEYEVIAWCLDPSCTEEDFRKGIQARLQEPTGTKVVFRQLVKPSTTGAECDYRHSVRIPGTNLKALRDHYFKVAARYVFPAGAHVPEPEQSGIIPELVSGMAFSPRLLNWHAPRVEPFSAPYDDAPSGSALENIAIIQVPSDALAHTDAGDMVVECREGCPYTGAAAGNDSGVIVSGGWLEISAQPLPGPSGRLLLVGVSSQVCQFRIRCCGLESEASVWTDGAVWCPRPLPPSQSGAQVRSALEHHSGSVRMGLQGLAAALGVDCQGTLSAHLVWPRHPPQKGVVPLQRYQVRHREATAGEWQLNPAVQLPPEEVDIVQHRLPELQVGASYEFSVRICNALGRWSEWSATTEVLSLNLPLCESIACGGEPVRIVRATASTATVAWRPFAIPRRSPAEIASIPLISATKSTGLRSMLNAEYQLTVYEQNGNEICQRSLEGLVQLLELAQEDILPEASWLELEVALEPQRTYYFKVRCRLPPSGWGPMVDSQCLEPRLLPVVTCIPSACLLLSPGTVTGSANDKHRPMEAAVHVEWHIRGFLGSLTVDPESSQGSMVDFERVAAPLARYQLRSRSVYAESAWEEWPSVDAEAAHDVTARVISVDIPLHAAAGQLQAGKDYIFSARCADKYGRWSAWSESSQTVSLRIPELVPYQPEQGPGANLRFARLGDEAVSLEWPQFRPAANQGSHDVDRPLQKILYSLRLSKRLEGAAEWQRQFLREIESERKTPTMTYELSGLDVRYEYSFHLQARWADAPSALEVGWTQEISSQVLPSRLRPLRTPESPLAEIVASDDSGLFVRLNWRPCTTLRNSVGAPVAGARYQVCVQQGPFDLITDDSRTWKALPPVSDEPVLLEGLESSCVLRDLSLGQKYRFCVRVGDAHRWSDWSPASEHLLLAVPPPMPSPGDVLEVRVPITDAAVLEWRPFRTTPGLCHLEYKITCMEWECENAKEEVGGVLARLRRAAELGQGGPSAARPVGGHRLRTVGYVTHRNTPTSRPQAERIIWKVENLKPGMYCRFFVCARHAALPFGAAAPPSTYVGHSLAQFESLNAGSCAWPDEHCAWLRDEDVTLWESSLSKIGMWSSSVLSTSDTRTNDTPLYSQVQPTLTTSVPGRVPQLAITHEGMDISPSAVGSTLHLPIRVVTTTESNQPINQGQSPPRTISMPVQANSISAHVPSETAGPPSGRAMVAQAVEGRGLGYIEEWHTTGAMPASSPAKTKTSSSDFTSNVNSSPSRTNFGARAHFSSGPSGPGSIWNDMGDGEV
jgi:hypothetical protein